LVKLDKSSFFFEDDLPFRQQQEKSFLQKLGFGCIYFSNKRCVAVKSV